METLTVPTQRSFNRWIRIRRFTSIVYITVATLQFGVTGSSETFDSSEYFGEKNRLTHKADSMYGTNRYTERMISVLDDWRSLRFPQILYDSIFSGLGHPKVLARFELAATRDPFMYTTILFQVDTEYYFATGNSNYIEEGGAIHRVRISSRLASKIMDSIESLRIVADDKSFFHKGGVTSNPMVIFIQMNADTLLRTSFFIYFVQEYLPEEPEDLLCIVDSLLSVSWTISDSVKMRSVLVPLPRELISGDSFIISDSAK